MELTRRTFVGAAAAAAAAGAMGALAGTAGAEEKLIEGVPESDLLAALKEESEVVGDYVQEDGKVIPNVYLRLRNRVNRIGCGMGSPVVDGCWDIFFRLFSEEDAENYLKMPMLEWFRACDLALSCPEHTEQEWREICEDMSMRGLLVRVRRGGDPNFFLSAWVHGLFEFSLNRYGEEGFVNDVLLKARTAGQETMWIAGSGIYRPIPGTADVVGDETVVPYDDIDAIIERSDPIGVSPCQCRGAREALGVLACEHPMETCMTFGEMAEFYIENGWARQIDKDEAHAILQRSVDEGMVLQSDYVAHTEIMCSCHSDCCFLLAGIRALDGQTDCMDVFSNYDLVLDKDACIKCGACIDRCPMAAVSFGEDGYPQMDDACVHCGQCAIVCPASARWLTAREELLDLPDSLLGDYIKKATVRMARGHVWDFTNE